MIKNTKGILVWNQFSRKHKQDSTLQSTINIIGNSHLNLVINTLAYIVFTRGGGGGGGGGGALTFGKGRGVWPQNLKPYP